MFTNRLMILIGASLFVAGVVAANTGSIFRELYPSGAGQIRLIQSNIATVRKDIASTPASEFISIVETVRPELEIELLKQFDLLDRILRAETTGRRLSLERLSPQDRNELQAALEVFVGLISIEEGITDETFYNALSALMKQAYEGGTLLVALVTSQESTQTVEEAQARLILHFARFDLLTSYFIILTEHSG